MAGYEPYHRPAYDLDLSQRERELGSLSLLPAARRSCHPSPATSSHLARHSLEVIFGLGSVAASTVEDLCEEPEFLKYSRRYRILFARPDW